MSSGGWSVTLSSLLGVARLDRVRREHPQPGVLGERVARRHRHDRVEVHERPRLGMYSATILCAAPAANSSRREQLHRLRRGALAHPDQHRAAADDEHVAALHGGRAVGRRRPTSLKLPRRRTAGASGRSPRSARSRACARPSAHRVDRDAVVDPAGGVAGEQVVGQRRQEEVVAVRARGTRPTSGPACRSSSSRLVMPADQVLGQLAVVESIATSALRRASTAIGP